MGTQKNHSANPGDDPVRASDVEAKAVKYLWPAEANLPEGHDEYIPGILPEGMLTTIAGRPGEGKSMTTAYLAAYVSNLKEERNGVLFSNMEDAVAQVLRPRLEAAGADLKNVHFFNFNLPKEPEALAGAIEMLERMILALNIRMIVADPIAAHLQSSLYNDQEVRRALSPLTKMLARTETTFVAVAHVNKHTSKKAHPLSAIGGSGGGLVGASRAVYVFGKDPEDEAVRVLAPAKFNLGVEPSSVAFDMESEEWTLGSGTKTAIIRTGKLSLLSYAHPATASTILAGAAADGEGDGTPAEKKAIAAEWLTGYLSQGQITVADVRKDAADQGISWMTLRRAAEELGVRRIRIYTQGTGKRGVDHVEWALPDGLLKALGLPTSTDVQPFATPSGEEAPVAASDDSVLAGLEAALAATDEEDEEGGEDVG